MMKLKKLASMVLALVLCLTLAVPAMAAETKQQSTPTTAVVMEVPEGMVLLATDVSTADDGEGNQVEVTIWEYGTPGSNPILGQGQAGVTSRSIIPEHEVGYREYFTFDISNNELGIPSLAAGVPLTSAMKSAIAHVVKEKLGEKLAASLIPGLNITSWVLAAIALTNSLCGNTGFRVGVNCVYSETYLHGQGCYLYGWDINGCTFVPY